jgi:hypothetical protein
MLTPLPRRLVTHNAPANAAALPRPASKERPLRSRYFVWIEDAHLALASP